MLSGNLSEQTVCPSVLPKAVHSPNKIPHKDVNQLATLGVPDEYIPAIRTRDDLMEGSGGVGCGWRM